MEMEPEWEILEFLMKEICLLRIKIYFNSEKCSNMGPGLESLISQERV